MNILLINGSPKGKRSNSLRLANSFIEGFKEGYKSKNEAISIDEMHVASMNVGACKGCFACWQKTPGVCCINDDMQTVIGKMLEADVVVLPDGTRVSLGTRTSFSYDSRYGKSERIVQLEGEAYFEVAKDTTLRFIVKAGEMEVEALGTTFNVKAYQEDGELTTTLFEGKVRTSVGKDEVILKPDESLSFDKSSRRMIVSDDLAAYARMWKDNELVFKGATMEEVAVMLDRLYNVKVRFTSEKVKHYRFSGVIKNNSLDNVIELISLTAPIMYKKVGGEIIIEERK